MATIEAVVTIGNARVVRERNDPHEVDVEVDFSCGRREWTTTFTVEVGVEDEHTESSDCWCEPEVIEEDGGDVIVHRERH